MSSILSSCIYCNHKKLWKYDFYKDMQVYKCKSCGREFIKAKGRIHYLYAVIDDKSLLGRVVRSLKEIMKG